MPAQYQPIALIAALVTLMTMGVGGGISYGVLSARVSYLEKESESSDSDQSRLLRVELRTEQHTREIKRAVKATTEAVKATAENTRAVEGMERKLDRYLQAKK